MKHKRLQGAMRHIGRWTIAIALAWIGHAPVFASEIALMSHTQATMLMSMADYQPCAACYMAPAPATSKLGNGDRPDAAAASWITYQAQIPACPETAAVATERPQLPLRVRYCRWLN